MAASVSVHCKFSTRGRRIFRGVVVLKSREMSAEATRFIGPDKCLGSLKER